MFEELKRSYLGVFNIFQRYWLAYGGWKAIVFSPYFHGALLLSLALEHTWADGDWWNTAITILPSVIGFSLGGFAIWLGFGDEKFRQLISHRNDEEPASPYIELSATFAHFIVIQLIALIAALIAQGTAFSLPLDHWLIGIFEASAMPADLIPTYLAPLFHFFGYLLFVYALMTALAATLAVFRVASWFEKFRNMPESADEETSSKETSEKN